MVSCCACGTLQLVGDQQQQQAAKGVFCQLARPAWGDVFTWRHLNCKFFSSVSVRASGFRQAMIAKAISYFSFNLDSKKQLNFALFGSLLLLTALPTSHIGCCSGFCWLGPIFIYQGLQAKAVEKFPKHQAIKSLPVLQNKHLVMWSLVAAATGMFVGAGMAGIKGNEDLRDIYDRRTGGSLTEQQVRVRSTEVSDLT